MTDPATVTTVPLTLECREDTPEGVAAVLYGKAVPYNDPADLGGVREAFAPGAFDPAQVIGRPLCWRHGDPIGVVTAAHSDSDALWVTAEVADTAMGRDAATLLRRGAITGLSVGFVPTESTWGKGRDLVTRVRATLRELSLTHIPAYPAAQVATVREEPTVSDTATTATAEAVDTQAREAIAEVRDLVTQVRESLPTGPTAHPLAEYRSLGEYAQAVYTGDASPDLLVRAIVDQITPDNPGVLPPSWAMDVKGIVNLGRPAVSAFGVESAGASGMDFAWPYFDGDLSVLVGKQATQKTDVASVKVSLKKGTASLDTYAGGSDISYQLIQRSAPSYLAAYLRIMAAAYAVVTDKAFGAALVAAGTAQTGYDFAADTDGSKLAAALFAASVSVESATGQPAGFALVASDVFAKAGGMTALVNPAYGPNNAAGLGSARTLAVQVNGLPVIHSRGLPAGTIIVSNESAASWIEDGPRVADAEVPTRLGRDVAVYGFGTAAVYVPTGVIKVTKA